MRHSSRPDGNIVKTIYSKLYRAYGPQSWWPGETPLEVMVGAVLTQNTNWGNVEKAIRNLKRENALSLVGLSRLPQRKLAAIIRPAGYFNVKAKRLKNLVRFLMDEYRGNISVMKAEPLGVLRKKLLSVNGIGEETADSIILYSVGKPAFVVDAYTRRIFYRHNLIDQNASYQELQELFTNDLKKDPILFNEYHALIVRLGKDHCRPTPDCSQCPLNHVAYSLKYKCSRCHRGLLLREKKNCFDPTGSIVCRNCLP